MNKWTENFQAGFGVLIGLFCANPSAFATDWETMLPEIAKSQAQVLFFGDSHSQDFYKTALQELLAELHRNDPAWNCVALEMDPVWVQNSVEQVQAGTLPRSELARSIMRSLPEGIRPGYSIDFFEHYVSDFLPEPLFDVLRDTNSRFFAIDLPKTEKYIRTMQAFPDLRMGGVPTDAQWDERNRMQLIERNAEMARRITELFDSGKCSRVLAFVGTEHMTQSGKLILSDEWVKSTPQLLESRYRVESLVLFFDQDEKDRYQKFLEPSPRTSMLRQQPIPDMTYTPTISRW